MSRGRGLAARSVARRAAALTRRALAHADRLSFRERVADLRYDEVPLTLFARRVIQRDAVDQPAGEIASAIPDVFVVEARDGEEAGRDAVVAGGGNRKPEVLLQERSRGIVFLVAK